MKTYKDAGVDKEEGYQTVSKIKKAVSETHNSRVLNGIGSFGAFFDMAGYKHPILVSGTDGVGTKLRIALDVKKYDTVGVDCFAMCANDILCHGAQPLFFLDYLACGKLDSDVAAEIVMGIAGACKETGTALVGGETAEMPGMYQVGDYDVAGFCVGVVEKDQIIDGSKIQKDDVLIALASSGFHSNGFSLIRKVFTDYHEDFQGKPLYQTLLEPTKLYVKPVLELLKEFEVSGLAHITGGGLEENVPRIIPEGLCAKIDISKVEVPPVMQLLKERSGIQNRELFGTFNMGVGMVLVVKKQDQQEVISKLAALGETAYVIGEIIQGEEKIEFENID
ncbi:MAG: phosphoribosylformylglycinamidine cyclo-ligase [Flavobacteriaceae bacterium]|nr:MAG: phosphoribosylformylglycinamidine cyclo-ligase [Flavobacteriaceae bacterium]